MVFADPASQRARIGLAVFVCVFHVKTTRTRYFRSRAASNVNDRVRAQKHRMVKKEGTAQYADAQLAELHPDEIGYLRTYTELSKPVFYGPGFVNVDGKQAS